MTLMPDDEPEQLPPPAVIPPDGDFLPALVGTESPVGPARAYLLSLNSPRSRQTMASFLGIVAGMLGAASLESCSWGSLRRSEAVGLDLRDVVTDERALRVLGKGNKERLAYMPAGTWQRLRTWIDDVRGEKDGPLFTRIRRFDTLTNDRLTDQAVYHVLQVRQRQAGVTKCAPHDLRRTFAQGPRSPESD